MAELDKVIKGLERCKLYNKLNCEKCPYDYNGRGNGKSECTAELASDVLELLKEQDDMGKELCDAVELIHKKNERIEKLLKEQETQKFFVDESGKITPLPVVVRCKDCANGEVRTQSWDGVQYVECHAHEEEGYDHEDGHPLDWFCADGVVK